MGSTLPESPPQDGLDPARPDLPRQALTGWGRTAPTAARVVHAHSGADMRRALQSIPPRGLLGRGLGRSYGDAAQNAGGTVVATAGAGEYVLDPETGVVTASAGASLDELLRGIVPWGYFVPVSPGTRYVTVGGAIAADIHGKNHHHAGSWCSHVRSFDLALPDGSVRTVTPENEPSLFWATAGGMGLTGLILQATFQCQSIPSSRLAVDTECTTDLDDVLERMASRDHEYDFSVAWIDLMATGRTLGRSVLTRGWFATPDQLPAAERRHPFAYDAEVLLHLPAVFPSGLLNPVTIRAFNELWYRKAPTHREGEIQTIPQFWHPLDMVGGWNHAYGPRGFLQWQLAIPFGSEDALRTIVGRFAKARCTSLVNVLKRFGPGNPGPLSFPIEGWTLSVDIAIGNPLVPRLLDELDEIVLEVGGRLYLAKDSRLRPDHLPLMYPELDAWRSVKAIVDPLNQIQSDLGRRLGLC